MTKISRLTFPLIAAALLGGCSILGSRPSDETPVIGERQSVLGAEVDIGIDPTTAALPMALPAARANANWEQSGGNAAKSMGHLALGDSLGQAWSRSIGRGGSSTARLTATPVVADGRLFVIDTAGVVSAMDATSGAVQWRTNSAGENANRDALYGGGVAYGNGRVYATNGVGDVVALDPANGGVVWRVQPAGTLRGAPTFDGTNLYVTSQDNQLYALNISDGSTRWSTSASLEIAGVFGNAAPAAGRGTVVAGFSSGELNAYRYENGNPVWGDALSRTSISRSVATLTDIDADPVIDGNQVIAIGQGGRMVALDLLRGQRLWELSLAGTATPYVAGEWVFVVTEAGQLLSIARNNGGVRWINSLPRYRNVEKKRGPIFYSGPVLAGGRLILTSSEGMLIEVDPSDGSIRSQRDLGRPFSLQPVVAGSTLYLLDDNGVLTAHR
ncbi:PQQ-binding-like beta-propeller repeat protein [Sphingomicrobium sp. XHP0235]|uniref:outer membrane protein assembly factor BamB family protein n=1 Tax=Sphingomicrobium aquimarinum TaxID=3133971 RepID=UPI0031FE4A92